MIDWFIRRRWLVTVGDVGWWHGRRNYPGRQHGIAIRLHIEAPVLTDEQESNVAQLRLAGETRHG